METFTIYITFDNNGQVHTESHTEETVVSAIQRLLHGPGAIMGLYREIKIVDTMDCTNFLWTKAQGLIFPKAA